MQNKLILIGASGTIGSAVFETARENKLNILPTYQTRAITGGRHFNLETDSPRLLDIADRDVLIIFAAHSNQEWVRTHPSQARDLNVTATARLADEARHRGAHIIFISSEAVFGKNQKTGWNETSQPCPTTEYGKQKYEMEQILQSLGGACIVRTGWNVPSRPSDRCVVASTYKSLLDGDARLAEDNWLSLTDVHDTAKLIIQVAMERVNGIVHAVSGVPITRTEIADEIIRKSAEGEQMRYQRIKFSDLFFSEPKPASAWLASDHEILHHISPFAGPREVVAKKVLILDCVFAKQNF